MTNDLKSKCHIICKHYGTKHQCMKAVEEMAELQQALVKTVIGDDGDLDNVVEEIADVCVMLEQLRYIFDPSGIDVRVKIKNKLDRQLKRMESENDDRI